MIAALIPLLTSLVSPVSKVINKRTDRKAAEDSLKNKAAMSTIDAKSKQTLTDAEWEIVKAKAESGSWKDEYITIVVTSPIAGIILGSLLASFTGNTHLIDGSVAGINALNDTGIPMGELMTATVFAGIGLKLWRA